MTLEQRNEILENAYIPEEWREHCFITEEEMIFTPLFNEDGEMIKTGEQVYTEWMENKDKPVEPVETPEQKIKRLESEVEALNSELTATNQYMTDLELMIFEMHV